MKIINLDDKSKFAMIYESPVYTVIELISTNEGLTIKEMFKTLDISSGFLKLSNLRKGENNADKSSLKVHHRN